MSIDPQKHAIVMNLSRDLALEYGLVEPTERERAEREEWSRKFAERQAAAKLRKGEWLAALASVADPALRAVIDLHDIDGGQCRGCDQGCSCDLAEWPCSTIKAILDALGADATDIDLADWRTDT